MDKYSRHYLIYFLCPHDQQSGGRLFFLFLAVSMSIFLPLNCLSISKRYVNDNGHGHSSRSGLSMGGRHSVSQICLVNFESIFLKQEVVHYITLKRTKQMDRSNNVNTL